MAATVAMKCSVFALQKGKSIGKGENQFYGERCNCERQGRSS